MHISNKNFDKKITANFINIRLWYLIPAIFILSLFFYYFIFVSKGSNFIDNYIFIQKDMFFYLNSKLSKYPSLQFNLTQFGDVLISFSLLSVFIVYAPKFWEALITSAILSLIVSATLKKIFSVPRPAAVFDNHSFNIIGKTLSGHTSLPSGHSMATFTVITVLFFAFIPKNKIKKIGWLLFMFSIGLNIVFSRVGVGAHYPFDVIIGSILGYIVAILGIVISNKMNWFVWIKNKKYYPFLIIALVVCAWIIINKLINTNLLIYYFSLSTLIISLYLMINIYVKKN